MQSEFILLLFVIISIIIFFWLVSTGRKKQVLTEEEVIQKKKKDKIKSYLKSPREVLWLEIENQRIREQKKMLAQNEKKSFNLDSLQGGTLDDLELCDKYSIPYKYAYTPAMTMKVVDAIRFQLHKNLKAEGRLSESEIIQEINALMAETTAKVEKLS